LKESYFERKNVGEAMSPRQHKFIESIIFNFKMGASSQSLHPNDAHDCFYFIVQSNRVIIDHGLHKVAANMNT
jgi:hypothetical protein